MILNPTSLSALCLGLSLASLKDDSLQCCYHSGRRSFQMANQSPGCQTARSVTDSQPRSTLLVCNSAGIKTKQVLLAPVLRCWVNDTVFSPCRPPSLPGRVEWAPVAPVVIRAQCVLVTDKLSMSLSLSFLLCKTGQQSPVQVTKRAAIELSQHLASCRCSLTSTKNIQQP